MTTSDPKASRVLVVDDDASIRRVLGRHLEDAGYVVETAENGSVALRRLQAGAPFDALLTDLKMPEMDGLTLLAEVKRLDPTVATIVLTAHGTVEKAVGAMRQGAFDFVEKPFHKDVLLATLERALEHRVLLKENLRLTLALNERFSLGDMLGGSDAMRLLFSQARRVAAAEIPLLLQGENGTGKELLARALHEGSSRSRGPFVALNVAALPEGLVEAELFGVVRGAFTGATAHRPGAFRAADGGTIVLDEVGEMRADLQAKLLRVLEHGQVRPVGADKVVSVDVRVIASTNRDLPAAVEAGAFRRDLYHRLAVVTLSLPALRDRREDIPLLVNHFLAKHGGASVEVDASAMQALVRYRWPGNVRELENEIRRALLLRAQEQVLALDDLSTHVREGRRGGVGGAHAAIDLERIELPEEGVSLAALERVLIERALARTGGNQTRAAELLGITRQTLIYRMEKHGLRVRNPD